MGIALPVRAREMTFVAPTATDLADDRIHVWLLRLHECADLHTSLMQLLTPDEHARADRFRFPVDQRRYVAARGTLRLLLAAYSGMAPDALAFDYTCVCGNPQCAMSRRKPVLRPGLVPVDLRFNISHSADVALFAVAMGREVGVDIEQVRPEIDWRALAEEALSPVDAAAVLERTGRDGLLAFYRCWTHKEAFLKALGRGLTTPRAQQPQDLSRAALHADPAHVWDYDGRHFAARRLDGVPADCVGALVIEGPASTESLAVRALPIAQLRSTVGGRTGTRK